jgi:ATP-dependent RNA helicase DDX56/DBP9
MSAPPSGWDDLGLDPRLLRALAKLALAAPLPVQAAAVPEALRGRDVVARARTGSGKTLAYLLPALHRVLAAGAGPAGWQALILVPTRELVAQVAAEAAALAAHCGAGLRATALPGDAGPARAAAAGAGQLVVATPARVAALLADGTLSKAHLAAHLTSLVLDEADLLLGYGHEADVAALAPAVPRACQCMLMSATSSADVDRLTKLVLHAPVSLDLLGAAGGAGNGDADAAAAAGAAAEIAHFRLDLPAACAGAPAAEMTERLLHLLALLKLGLVPRKVLVFVNSADAGMRARLFLDAFGVRAAALHGEQPLNSRHHLLAEFNRGLFDFLIATDDAAADAASAEKQRAADGKRRDKRAFGKDKKGAVSGKDGGKAAARRDAEFGVTRGVDFRGVGTVVNLEPPADVASYVHRAGRTGRAGAAGLCLTIVAPSDRPRAAALAAALDGAAGFAPAAAADAAADASVSGAVAAPPSALRPFDRLTRAAVEGLRYRGEDVARSITRGVVREARAADLRAELLNSRRLAAHFAARPGDLALLRHDRPLGAKAAAGAAAPHLKALPAYVRDPALRGGDEPGGGNGAAGGRMVARRRRPPAGVDPVKGGGGFARAPRRGGDRLEAPTALEERAEKAGSRERKALAKRGALPSGAPGAATFAAKRNVKKLRKR